MTGFDFDEAYNRLLDHDRYEMSRALVTKALKAAALIARDSAEPMQAYREILALTKPPAPPDPMKEYVRRLEEFVRGLPCTCGCEDNGHPRHGSCPERTGQRVLATKPKEAQP